jgi:hypothetical protein
MWSRRSIPGEGDADGLSLAARIALRVSATTLPEGSDEIVFAMSGSRLSMGPSFLGGRANDYIVTIQLVNIRSRKSRPIQ